jgi:predicted transcriptional regulator
LKTISQAVSEYIKSKPFLSSALNDGIINLTSLSRQIKPEVEEILRKKVNNGAIVMALNRLSISLEFQYTHKIVKVLKNIGDITVRSNLVDYNFKVSDTLLSNQSLLLKDLNDNKKIFYTSSRGVDECNIVVSEDVTLILEEKLSNEICLSKTDNLCSISFKLPEENVSIPGIYYFVFQKLSWDGINISQIISTSNEFTILVAESEVDKAFSIINKLKSI